MAASHPWMPLYVTDWLEDRELKRMPRVARSLYFDMLCHEWIGGPLPDDMREVAIILGELPRSLAAHWPSIRQRFVIDSSGKLAHEKLESLRNAARIISEKRSNAAKLKHSRSANAHANGNANALLSQSQHSHSTTHTEESPRSATPSRGGQGVLAIGSAVEEPKQPAPLHELFRVYAQGWVETFRPTDGKAPKLAKADIKAASELLKAYGQTEASSLIRRFLADSDKFLVGRGHVLRDIGGRVNGYRATKQPTRRYSNFAEPMQHATETHDEEL